MLTKKSSQPKQGIHHSFPWDMFPEREKQIIKNLGREWYITKGGKIKIAASTYYFFLLQPTALYNAMFNIDRELIAVLSPYETFETRTVNVFDSVKKNLQELRTENVCRILISEDSKIEEKINNWLKSDPEQPIVVPFSYTELLSSYDDFFIRNRFRKHFYSRDLFSFLSPLKRDLYFYGRSVLVHDLINRHKSGEHIGLFGLRKSGKTSIIYAVERVLQLSDEQFVSIDCELPSVHKLRWNELLHRIALEYHKVKESRTGLPDAAGYTEKQGSDAFHADMLRIYNSKKRRSVLVMFDEIERISPGTGSSEHWKSGEDFVYFWQTMRGFYQRHPEVFTYMVVGTNPSCIEFPLVSSQV